MAESYTGTARLAATGSVPEPPNEFRTATYQRFDFQFTPEVKLPEQERSLLFIDQDIEPEIEVDRFGSITSGRSAASRAAWTSGASDNGGARSSTWASPTGRRTRRRIRPPRKEEWAEGT